MWGRTFFILIILKIIKERRRLKAILRKPLNHEKIKSLLVKLNDQGSDQCLRHHFPRMHDTLRGIRRVLAASFSKKVMTGGMSQPNVC